jgi:hypothetical protein
MKDVEGFEGKYAVTQDGRVWSYPKHGRKGSWMKQSINNTGKGYCRVDLFDGHSNRKPCLVHRLVAKAFIPNPNDYPYINHKNGDTQDNRVENLEWCTQKMNCQHAFRTGLSKMPCLSGEKHPMASITEDDVREVRRMNKHGFGDTKISQKLGITRSVVKGITKGITWTKVV